LFYNSDYGFFWRDQIWRYSCRNRDYVPTFILNGFAYSNWNINILGMGKFLFLLRNVCYDLLNEESHEIFNLSCFSVESFLQTGSSNEENLRIRIPPREFVKKSKFRQMNSLIRKYIRVKIS